MANGPKKYDLLIVNGKVLDPANNINMKGCVAVKDGLIAKVGADIPPSDAEKVVDVGGSYIVPGLIDIHVHVYPLLPRGARRGTQFRPHLPRRILPSHRGRPIHRARSIHRGRPHQSCGSLPLVRRRPFSCCSGSACRRIPRPRRQSESRPPQSRPTRNSPGHPRCHHS